MALNAFVERFHMVLFFFNVCIVFVVGSLLALYSEQNWKKSWLLILRELWEEFLETPQCIAAGCGWLNWQRVHLKADGSSSHLGRTIDSLDNWDEPPVFFWIFPSDVSELKSKKKNREREIFGEAACFVVLRFGSLWIHSLPSRRSCNTASPPWLTLTHLPRNEGEELCQAFTSRTLPLSSSPPLFGKWFQLWATVGLIVTS